MLNIKYLLVLALSAQASFAAPSPTGPEQEDEASVQDSIQETVQAPASSGQLMGMVEIRPSYTRETDEFHTENLLELGYRFSPNFRIRFQEQINTNISDPTTPNEGLHPELMQGFLGATFGNIWANNGWSLSYEPRFYIPETDRDFASKRYGTLRNYVMLSKQVTDFYTLTLMEIPILHFHGARGFVSNSGAPVANQYYENRFYIMNDFTFGKFTFEFPILFVSQSKLDFGGVEGDWAHNLWFWPTVSYAIDNNMSVGVALYTESIVAPDLSGFTVTDKGAGLSNSVAQLLFRATL
jgi:hypothetical protein